MVVSMLLSLTFRKNNPAWFGLVGQGRDWFCSVRLGKGA
jgi:hypothetical protein